MKVICIKGGQWYHTNTWIRKHWWSKKTRKPMCGPQKDDVVTVEKEYWSNGQKYYHLVEWPNGYGYEACAFTPLQESTTEYKEVTLEKIKEKTPVPSVN
jgi:hypothetical protein